MLIISVSFFFTSRQKGNVRAARMRYQLYLEEQRKVHAKSDKAKKRKAVEDEIRKRKLLSKSIQAMS